MREPMQVIIEEVVCRVRATSAEAALSAATLNTVIGAVFEAIEHRDRRCADRDEELSLENYQQRNRLGTK